MKTNTEIWAMMKDNDFVKADEAIRQRLAATNLNIKQQDALMYYAYEQGHSAGQYEVCLVAMNLLNDIAEAK